MSAKPTNRLTNVPVRAGASVVEQMERTGFSAVWDVNDGLTHIWLCFACATKVAEAWRTIIAICKTDTLSFSGCLRWYDAEVERRQKRTKDGP